MNAYLIIKEEEHWNRFIKRSKTYDAYHFWQYHIVDQSGDPVMFVYQNKDLFIALPLIKRKISGTHWFDLTCVYGYGGPVSNLDFKDIEEQDMLEFRKQFLHFMKQEKCICVFSRLHPFLNQHYLLEKIGGVSGNGKTLYMDLTTSYEEQQAGYEKRLARQIRQLRKHNYNILDAVSSEAIDIFHDMYTENMLRVSASENYFFSKEYFTKFLEGNKDTSKLLMVYDGKKPACGAIILLSPQIIRNHLSATSQDYLKESPSKLLTDYISLVGREKGIKYFHLGGGVGGREDSLFKYKSYFSKNTIEDYIWRFIADNDAYNSLVEKIEASRSLQPDFFPLYRSRIVEVAG